jgi:hypothetical protein
MLDFDHSKQLLEAAIQGLHSDFLTSRVDNHQCGLARKKKTVSQSISVQARYFLQKASFFLKIFSVRSGFFAADRDGSPNLLLQMSWIVRTVA